MFVFFICDAAASLDRLKLYPMLLSGCDLKWAYHGTQHHYRQLAMHLSKAACGDVADSEWST